MNEKCGICGTRISDWMVAAAKCEVVDGKLLHRVCKIDYALRHGKEWTRWPGQQPDKKEVA